MKKQAAAKGKAQSEKQTTTKNNQIMNTTEKTDIKKTIASLEKKNYQMVPVKIIFVDETLNPREDYGNIEELMESIVENGLRNAVKGFQKDGKIYLREGFRRMRAVKLAIEKGFQIDKVPMLLEERPMTDEERTLEFLINNDGKPFTMLEQSIVIGRLLNFGWKPADIARKTGKAPGYIANLISLTKTPMVVQNYMKEDRISAHAVIGIMAEEEDAEDVIKEVEKAIKNAKASGKDKATPKHVEPKEKGPSHGKFYKFAEEILNLVAGQKATRKDREDMLSYVIVAYENGQRAKDVADRYFTDKSKVTPETAKAEKPEAKAPAKAAPKKAEAKKPAKKAAKKK